MSWRRAARRCLVRGTWRRQPRWTGIALRELTADLPAGPEGAPGPRPPAPPGQPDHAFSRLALASLLAALIPVYGTAAAIVMGHASRRRIRVTGERGARLAAAGLMIGYLTAAAYLAILLVMTVR